MLPPNKPWEGAGGNNLRNSMVDINSSVSGMRGGMPGVVQAPPVPRRDVVARNPSYLYGGYGGGYSNYGVYPGYSSMGSMGSYGNMYGMNAFENRFVQFAEESTQPAFDSVESFVRTFSSIAMMMESTYHAMSMSFRAVLSVAENMSKLKNVILEMLSSLNFFRRILSFVRRVLHLAGVPNMSEHEWERTFSESTVAAKPSKSLMPMLATFGLFFGAPYLIYKAFNNEEPDEMVSLVAMYDYAPTRSDELAMKKGDIVQVPKRNLRTRKDWLKVVVNGKSGLVPTNRLGVPQAATKE